MKIALISDVHGNLPALDAVLTHAGEMKASQIWNLGDATGFGAFPDEVVLLLKKKKAINLIGNYDAKVLKVPHKLTEWKNQMVPEKWVSFQWSYDQLSKKSRDYLAELPETHKEEIKGWKVLFTHGSPDANDEALTDDTPQERLRDLAKMSHANIILCGHSHQAFMRFAGGSIFINPGSVGRPFDGDPRASYALLTIKKHKVEVDFFRIEYDVEKAAVAQEQAGLPPEFAEMTRQAVNLKNAGKKDIDEETQVVEIDPEKEPVLPAFEEIQEKDPVLAASEEIQDKKLEEGGTKQVVKKATRKPKTEKTKPEK
jgi:putative phosphoesterase